MNWTSRPLSEMLSSMESGTRPRGGVKGISTGVPSLGGEHLTADGGFDFSSIRYVPRTFYDTMRRGRIQRGDILVVKDGATTGKVALVRDDFPYETAVVNEHVFVCRPGSVEGGYLYWFLRSPEGQRRVLEHFKGSAQGGITQDFARGTLVPVPSSETQRSITRILDAGDRRRESALRHLTASIRALDLLRHSALVAACSGRLTADLRPHEVTGEGELPFGWRQLTVEAIAADVPRAIQSGPFGSNLKHSEFRADGRLVIGIDNVLDGRFSLGKQHRISDKKFRELEKYAARPLDVLITVMATVGRICVVPETIEPAIITKHVYRITINQEIAEPYFVMYALRGHPEVRQQIEAQVRGQTRPGINGSIVKGLILDVPSLMEQRAIVQRTNALLTLTDEIEQRIERAASRVALGAQALLAKAFSGELTSGGASIAGAIAPRGGP